MDWVEIFNLAPGKKLYQYLKQSSPEEREILCRDHTFSDMCSLIDMDTRSKLSGTSFTQYGNTSLGFILQSFADFDTAMAYIKSVRPGFIYSDAFKDFVNNYVKEKIKNRKYEVTLGRYKYISSEKGNIIKTFINNKLHSFGDKPAQIVKNIAENEEFYRWYRYGQLHRENDKPAELEYFLDTKFVKTKSWYISGQPYREDSNLPVTIDYLFPNNNGIQYKEMETFRNREDKLNYIEYFNTLFNDKQYINTELYEKGRPDRLKRIIYYLPENGQERKQLEQFYPKLNKIAKINYRENGSIKLIQYMNTILELHRTDGPARIEFLENGDTKETWYNNGRRQREFNDAED